MSTKSEVKYDTTRFKPFEAPRRKAGLRDDQISISKHSISVPLAIANKLGQQVALLFSDTDKAVALQALSKEALQKDANSGYKLKQIGKLKSTRSVYCKTLLEAKAIKKGRYSTSFDEKNAMLIAKVETGSVATKK